MSGELPQQLPPFASPLCRHGTPASPYSQQNPGLGSLLLLCTGQVGPVSQFYTTVALWPGLLATDRARHSRECGTSPYGPALVHFNTTHT